MIERWRASDTDRPALLAHSTLHSLATGCACKPYARRRVLHITYSCNLGASLLEFRGDTLVLNSQKSNAGARIWQPRLAMV